MYFETIGKFELNRLNIGVNDSTPISTPMAIGNKVLIDCLMCKKKFAVASKMSSNTPEIIAAVPPLMPGTNVPKPMKIPFKILTKQLVLFDKEKPPNKYKNILRN